MTSLSKQRTAGFRSTRHSGDSRRTRSNSGWLCRGRFILPPVELTAVVATEAGMHALWDVATFQAINGYEAWAHELEEDADIERHIRAAHLVPINIRSDGAFCISVRADRRAMPTLSADEQRRVVVTSDAYRFTTATALR
jgi:hypothetical protein